MVAWPVIYRQVADSRHPITKTLTEIFGGKLSKHGKEVGDRIQKAGGEGKESPRQEIVSEKLISMLVKSICSG